MGVTEIQCLRLAFHCHLVSPDQLTWLRLYIAHEHHYFGHDYLLHTP